MALRPSMIAEFRGEFGITCVVGGPEGVAVDGRCRCVLLIGERKY